MVGLVLAVFEPGGVCIGLRHLQVVQELVLLLTPDGVQIKPGAERE